MSRTFALCLLFSLTLFNALSQTFPLHPDFNALLEQHNMDSSWRIHTSLKPVFDERLYPLLKSGWRVKPANRNRKVITHLTEKHFLAHESEDIYIALDPLLDFSSMHDASDTSARGNLFSNWRGLRCTGRLGKQVSFQTDFLEVQTRPAAWQRQWVDSLNIFPGFGRVKPFQTDAYDFAVSTGSVQYQPLHTLTLRIGSERQFIGNGYRSLLWSDAIFPTPFLQFRWIDSQHKWQYSSGFHLLQNLERLPKGEVPETLFKRKGASVHYLTLKLWRGAEIGVFESIVWNMYDSTGTHGPAAGAYLPLIGLNTVLHSNDTINNSNVGINISQYVNHKILLYGQFIADHLKAKRTGWQAGLRLFNAGLKGLNLLLEYNHLSPYLYAFESPLQSYSHMQQPIGHPAGGALNEMIIRLDYRRQRWLGRIHGSFIEQELSPASDVQSRPQDVMMTFAPPAYRTLINANAEIAFLINPTYSLEAVIGYQYRSESKNYNWMEDQQSITRLLYFGLRTSMFSRYNDF